MAPLRGREEILMTGEDLSAGPQSQRLPDRRDSSSLQRALDSGDLFDKDSRAFRHAVVRLVEVFLNGSAVCIVEILVECHSEPLAGVHDMRVVEPKLCSDLQDASLHPRSE